MPITAQCPGCGQTLQVGDEYAGATANCPTCGAAVTFAAAGAPQVPPPGAPAAGYPDVAGPPRDNAALFDLIGFAGAGFCTFLLIIGLLITWGGRSAIWFGDGRILFSLCLLLGAAQGLSLRWRELLGPAIVFGAFVGTLAFFFFLSLVTAGATGAGAWISLVAILGLLGACITTAVRRPMTVESPLTPPSQPFMHRFGALLISQGVALLFGLMFWVMTRI